MRLSGGVDADGRMRLRVQDNGAGFNPRFVQKMFHAFQRLHSGNEFEGLGMGLVAGVGGWCRGLGAREGVLLVICPPNDSSCNGSNALLGSLKAYTSDSAGLLR